MKIGNKNFDLNKNVYVMGILNVTPDSFSDGGRYNDIGFAMEHVKEMIEDGADIIDVGGESTRPGYTLLSDEEEIERVVPVIKKIKENFDIPISIDTYKSRVAQAAINAGADLVNDIWGLKYDNEMAKVISKYNVPCCLMHNRDMDSRPYKNYLTDVLNDLQDCVNIAHEAGIKDDKIIVDPGVGFGKTLEMNLQIMKNLELLKLLNYPILLGTSRKSMIGLTLDLSSNERVEGTVATSVMGVMKGCSIIRVHDVKENKRAIKMTRAILNS